MHLSPAPTENGGVASSAVDYMSVTNFRGVFNKPSKIYGVAFLQKQLKAFRQKFHHRYLTECSMHLSTFRLKLCFSACQLYF